MATTYLNGKFTEQRMTGVQRYAQQLVLALDASVPVAGAERWVLLCPPGARVPGLSRIQVRRVGLPGLPLHVWEQVVLPWAARGGLLVSLAGSAPLLARRQWCTFHDAAVFDHPASYHWRFVAWYRLHFRWLARHAERLLTVSAHSRGRLALRLGVAESAITVVPNGGEHLVALTADEAVVERLGLTGRRWLLAVGSDNPTKNLGALLQAWAQLPAADDLRLVVVGGGDPAVFSGRPGAPLPAGVVRAGVLDDAALKALYRQALGLVFPSLDEGFGLPPLEAMSLGCPVAAARAGAMPEVCGDAVLYFDPREPSAIAAAMARLVAEADLRQRLAQTGLQRATAWTWPRAAAALRTLVAAGTKAMA